MDSECFSFLFFGNEISLCLGIRHTYSNPVILELLRIRCDFLLSKESWRKSNIRGSKKRVQTGSGGWGLYLGYQDLPYLSCRADTSTRHLSRCFHQSVTPTLTFKAGNGKRCDLLPHSGIKMGAIKKAVGRRDQKKKNRY